MHRDGAILRADSTAHPTGAPMPAPLRDVPQEGIELIKSFEGIPDGDPSSCLLYTSDAADERSSVDLGGRRTIKKKTTQDTEDTQNYRHRTK